MAFRSGTGEGGTSSVQTGILLGQIVAVPGVALGGVWAATQWTAHALGYQEQLGPAWVNLAGLPVYAPWKLFEWWYWYDAYAPGIFLRGGGIAAASGLLATGVAIGMAIWRSRVVRRVTTYGSARWAEDDDIRKAGLHEPAGVFLGRKDERYLRHAGPEHVMAFAPTRSGKGVGLVVPTLLSWPGSTIVHDIKGENWELTPAGVRASRVACCSIRRALPRRVSIRCSKCGAARSRSATCRTSLISWSIRTARASGAIIGRRPRMRC